MSSETLQRTRAAYTESIAHMDYISILRHIEAGIIKDMAQQGYGRTQLQEALQKAGRYPKDEGTDVRRHYFDSILPTGEETSSTQLPSPADVFVRAYPARIEEHAYAPLKEQDTRILSEMLREGHAPGDIQEAYFGHSLFRHLLAEENTCNRFESDAFSGFMELAQTRSAQERTYAGERFAEEMQRLWTTYEKEAQDSLNLIPFAEGRVTAKLIGEEGYSAYTMQSVLLEESRYAGDDEEREVYADKLVIEALQMKAAYDRLNDAPDIAHAENVDELYAAMLREARKSAYDGLLDDTAEERTIAELVAEDFAKEEIAAAMRHHSPFLLAPARDKEAYIDGVLHKKGQGKAPYLHDAKKAYITAYDLYRRRRLAYDRLLHAQGKSIKGDDPDACARIARQLIAEKKATQSELKNLLYADQDARAERERNAHDQAMSQEMRQEERVRVRGIDS